MEWNLADLFEAIADAVPDRVALVHGDRRITYAELDARANQAAHAMQTRLVQPGEHVALYLKSSPEFLEAMLGAYKMRAVPINVNDRYVAAEVLAVADDADAVGLVMDDSRPAAAIELAGSGRWVLVTGAGGAYEEALAAESDARDFDARSGGDHYIHYKGGTPG